LAGIRVFFNGLAGSGSGLGFFFGRVGKTNLFFFEPKKKLKSFLLCFVSASIRSPD
jgi:hypothetical protein